MTVHPSVHLDLAREREQALNARTEHRLVVQTALCRETRGTGRSSSSPSGAAYRTSRATFRELAHRVEGGVDVTLLWRSRENRLAVAVFDEHAVELLVLDTESDKALDVFYHPYAHTR
jgi:hypothetical protein